MKCFIVLSALAAVALARPGHLLQSAHHVSHVSHVIPVAYAHHAPAAPIGHDGRVVDTPEVAHAKAEHLAAHAHEKAAQAHETHDSAELLTYAAAPVHVASYHAVAPVAYTKLVPAAPIGHDGRVVDTPEVAHAKAEHLAAHAHEKAAVAHESHDSAEIVTYAAAPVATSYQTYASLPVATSSYHGVHAYQADVAPVAYAKLVPAAPIGHDGRVVDTPEVAHAKAEHLAAHAHEKSAVAHESHDSAEIVTYAAAPVATSYQTYAAAPVATSYQTYAAAPVATSYQTYASVPVATSSYHGVHAYQAEVAPVAYAKLVPAAPIGHDGRVVDTPEVAHAKAAHEAAHAHEKLSLAHEEAKSGLYAEPQHVQLVATHSYAPHYVSAAHQW